MKLLIKGRGRGKSTGLIYTSEATGIPILTSTQASKRNILESAHNLGCDIPEPFTIQEARDCKVRGNRAYDKVLLDDMEFVLQTALREYLGCEVECATMSNTMTNIKEG